MAESSAPVDPHTIAGRLVQPGHFDLSGQGFSTDEAITCTSGGHNDAYAVRCDAAFHDAARNGGPAVVEIRLYDADQTLDAIDAPLKASVARMHDRWTLANTPDITVRSHATGQTRTIPGACHQALGRSNSAAYCVIMQSPRIAILTGVRPLRSSTRQLNISANGNAGDANQDVNHASDLAMFVIGQMQDTN